MRPDNPHGLIFGNPALIRNRGAEDGKDGSGLPEWCDLEAPGVHETNEGDFLVNDDKWARSLVASFREDKAAAGDKWGGILVDLDHFSMENNQSSRSAGWIVDMRTRPAEAGERFGQWVAKGGELVPQVKIDWSATGSEAVLGKDFKFFSTVYEGEDLEEVRPEKDGEPPYWRALRLSRLALTNDPKIKGNRPITNKSRKHSDGGPNGPQDHNTNPTTKRMTNIATQLGLPPEASESDIIAAIAQLQAAAKSGEADEVEAVLDRHSKKFRKEDRPVWRKALLTNRKNTEALLVTLPEGEKKEEDPLAMTDEEKEEELKEALAMADSEEDEELQELLAQADGEEDKEEQEKLVAKVLKRFRVLKEARKNRSNFARIFNRRKAKTPGSGGKANRSKEEARAAKIRNRAAEIEKNEGIRFRTAWQRAEAEADKGNW